MATRRSHIVRVYDDSSGEVNKSAYIDVEVLDAISFKIAKGEEVILNFPAKKASPFIVDDTGNGLAKQPGASAATRRSHVEHVKGENGELLIEVLDAIAFKDKRGEEWVLKMPAKKASPFNATKGSGSGETTRRTHNEKIGTDPNDKDPDADYLTVERSDMISFRSVRGREMILKMPSNDRGGKPGRASTFISSPENYDPTDDSDDHAPPENKDPDFYVKFVKDASPLTGDELLSQGPLWWIRKVSGPNILFVKIDLQRTNFPGPVRLLKSTALGLTEDVNVESDLTTKGAKLMPTTPDATPKLDLKEDTIWTGHPNPSQNTSGGTWSALIWFNVSKIRKGLDKGAPIELKFTVPKINKTKTTGVVGNYIWAVGANVPYFSGGYNTNLGNGERMDFEPRDQSTQLTFGFGPGPDPSPLALPNKDNFFLPYFEVFSGNTIDHIVAQQPFGAFDNYLRLPSNAYGLLYTDTSIRSADDLSDDIKNSTSTIGQLNNMTDFPGANVAGSNYGFNTIEGAQEWIAVYNSLVAAGAANRGPHTVYYPSLSDTRQSDDNVSVTSWIDPTDGGAIFFVPFSIDFGGTTPTAYQSLATTFTASLLHKSAYSYDAQNKIGFTLPTDPDKAPTLTINQTPGSNGKIVTVTLDKSNNVTVTQAPDPDQTVDP